MKHTKQTINSSIVSGFSVLIVREIFIKFFAFIGQLILARILVPEDFGFFVIISFIASFFNLFTDLGLSFAIIQSKKTPSPHALSAVFWLKILLSAIVIILIYIIAPSVILIYPQFHLSEVNTLRIFSVTFLITSLQTVPFALLERNLLYQKISLVDIVGVIVYQITAVLLAFYKFSLWSLIDGVIIKEIVTTVLVFWLQPFRPYFRFHYKDSISLLRFGSFLQGGTIVSFFQASLIPLLAGVIKGNTAVGLLDWAQNISGIPETITTNFGRVTFSNFSRIQHDRLLLKETIGNAIGLLSIVTLFLTVMILGFNAQIVPLLYSAKWIPGIPALFWFTTASFFISANASIGQGILALGRSHTIFIISLTTTIIQWLSAIFLLRIYGFTGIAMSATVVSIFTCIFYVYAARRVNILPNLLFILLPKFLVAIFTLIFIYIFHTLLSSNNPITLVVQITTACICYVFFTSVFAQSDLNRLIDIIRASIKGKEVKW